MPPGIFAAHRGHRGFLSSLLKRLVWFESHDSMQHAILREKQLESGSRAKKLALIAALNPDWRDLYEDIL